MVSTENSIYSNSQILPAQTINSDQQVLNRITSNSNSKEQLQKVSKEFEAIFITKMLNIMDKTVDREGGIFGEETSYYDKMKSFMFDELGRTLANSPRSSFGFANEIYKQMERYVQ